MGTHARDHSQIHIGVTCNFSVAKDINEKGVMGASAESGKQNPEHAHKWESKKNKSIDLVIYNKLFRGRL